MFDDFLERHFKAWVDSFLNPEVDREEFENGIRKYLEDNPEDVGQNWRYIKNAAFDAGYFSDELRGQLLGNY